MGSGPERRGTLLEKMRVLEERARMRSRTLRPAGTGVGAQAGVIPGRRVLVKLRDGAGRSRPRRWQADRLVCSPCFRSLQESLMS